MVVSIRDDEEGGRLLPLGAARLVTQRDGEALRREPGLAPRQRDPNGTATDKAESSWMVALLSDDT